MNEAGLHATAEQHGCVQLRETRSFVHELHVKVDSVYFTAKHYPLPVPILPPSVVPLCRGISATGFRIIRFPR